MTQRTAEITHKTTTRSRLQSKNDYDRFILPSTSKVPWREWIGRQYEREKDRDNRTRKLCKKVL